MVVAVVEDVAAELLEHLVVLEVEVVVVHTQQEQEELEIHLLLILPKVLLVVLIDQVDLNILQEVVVERLLLVEQEQLVMQEMEVSVSNMTLQIEEQKIMYSTGGYVYYVLQYGSS